VTILPTDKIIACLKAGWRFLLAFDLSGTLDLPTFQKNLARVYRYLMFREEYAVLENQELFDTLLSNGWFPFSEMIGVDFRKLETAFRYADIPEKKVSYLSDVHAGFSKERLDRLMDYWWRSPQLSTKKAILSEAVAAYIEGKYISCIKILYSEIEGVVRLQYHKESGHGPTFSELRQFIAAKARKRSPDPGSLGFPAVFAEYLDRNIFANFDLDAGTVVLSRHSAEHGVAGPEAYDRDRALQAILTLDQIRFYLF
jgi:hypothetical protein